MIVDRLQRPLQELRISVTDACTFRCLYCMPPDRFPDEHPFLPPASLLSFAEIVTLTEAFASLGLRKLKLTGGEPLQRPGIPDLVAMIKERLPALELTLTTNAFHLSSQLTALRAAGLDRVTISLDALDPAVFERMIGRHHSLERVISAIEDSREIGFDPVKINMVVIRGHNDDQIEAMAQYFRRPGYVLRFIEYMDVGTINRWNKDLVVSSAEVKERLEKLGQLELLPARQHSETAQRYTWSDASGEIGFISSVSQPFCTNCSRARIAANGTLHTCLFSGRGTDLRGPLRQGASAEAIANLVSGVWQQRTDRYSEERGNIRPAGNPKPIEMYRIGG